MATDAINFRIIATVTNDDLPGEPPFDVSTSYDQTTPVIERGVQLVGMTPEVLRLGDVGTAGASILRNLSATATIEIGRMISAVFEAYDSIGPSEARVVKPPAGVSLYAQADEADARLGRFIPSV